MATKTEGRGATVSPRFAGDHSEVDARLDEALEETFPASDPVSINVRPRSWAQAAEGAPAEIEEHTKAY